MVRLTSLLTIHILARDVCIHLLLNDPPGRVQVGVEGDGRGSVVHPRFLSADILK